MGLTDVLEEKHGETVGAVHETTLSIEINSTAVRLEALMHQTLLSSKLYFNSTTVRLEGIPEDVILSFTRKQGLHFRAQPFYPFLNEDILIDTDTEFRVKLTIIINDELVFELARLGDSVKVIAPQTLAEKLTGFFRQSLARYTITD